MGKIFLKFNHDAEDLLASLDCPFTHEEVDERASELFMEFMEDDKYQNKSHFAELIHNNLDYSAILYLATSSLIEQIEKKLIMSKLKEMLNKDEDI